MIFFDLDMFFPYLDDCSSLDEVALDPTAQEVCQRVLTDLMGRNDADGTFTWESVSPCWMRAKNLRLPRNLFLAPGIHLDHD